MIKIMVFFLNISYIHRREGRDNLELTSLRRAMRQNLLRCAQHFLWVSAVICGVSGLSVRAEEPSAVAPVETPTAAPVAAPVVVSEESPVAEFVVGGARAACPGDVWLSCKGARRGNIRTKQWGIGCARAR